MRGKPFFIFLPAKPRLYALVAMIVLLAGIGCGRESVLDKAQGEYDAGRYREAMFLIRHHFRKGGERTPELLFLAGRSYLKLGVEAEVEDAFAEAYSTDSTWAPAIARVLHEEAQESFEQGLMTKGRRFLLQSIDYDPRQDFGAHNRVAGELLLERKDFEGAAYYFDRSLSDFPDTTGAAEVMMNLGIAYEGMGEVEEAIEVYERFWELYPRSRLGTTVQWKLENLLLEQAIDFEKDGESEAAEGILMDLVAASGNPLVLERANFLLGEICEQRGELDRAVSFYREVVNLNLGSSGRLVERAKERIERLEVSRTRP